MGIFICLFCVVFSQVVYAKVIPYSAQNAVNIEHKLPFSYKNAISRAGVVPTPNRFAKHAATSGNIYHSTATSNANANIGNANIGNYNTGNSNTANANIPNPINLSNANANRVNAIIENVNPSTTNQVNTNIGNAYSATSNFADVKLPAQNLANNIANNNKARTSLQGNYPNLGYTGLSNSNLINSNIRPDLANQPYRPNFAKPIGQLNQASPIFGNIANTYNAPNTYKPFGSCFNMANSNAGLASYLPNFGDGNIAGNSANGNIANALATGSLANAIMPGSNFAIGGNPFTVLSGLPGNHEIGLSIVAEALEVGGSVSVAGKMPFYGTVALSGNLPSDGTATVSYGCTS